MVARDVQDKCDWDVQAQVFIPPTFLFSEYIGKSCVIVVNKVLQYAARSKPIRLLKTDLWNEAVETERDILINLDKRFAKTDAFDVSKIVCRKAKTKMEGNIVQSSCQNLPYRSGSYNAIIDLSTIDHLPENLVSQILDEYKRVLDSNGVLGLIYWQRNFAVNYLMKLKWVAPKQYYFDRRKVDQEINKRFSILEEYYIGFLLADVLFYPTMHRLPKRLTRILAHLAAFIEPRLKIPSLMGLRIIIACRD